MTRRIARILGRPNIGGPARTVLALSRGLRAHGFETLLLVGEPEPAEGNLFAGVSDVPIRTISGLRRALGLADLRAVGRLRAVLEEYRPDLVHTHAAKAGVLGRLAALRLRPRPKIVHTFHGHVLHGYFSRPLSVLFTAVERRLARSTDALVAVSERVAAELAERHLVAPRRQFRVIDNGIDLTPFHPPDARSRRAARLRLGCAEIARCVVVPARLVPIKGHAVLFEALRLLPERVLPVEVHLLGDGVLRAALERAARELGPGITVRFHGFRDDLPGVLPAADVAVLPSRSEGLPLALIDAMAAAVPVVAMAVGGVPDLVENGVTGLLARPGDAGSLAFALARVLDDLELARSLAQAGQERVADRHSIDRVILEHARLYDELLGSPGAP